MADRLTGHLVRWIADRGFGFLRPENGGKDIFVHATDLADAGIDDPAEGMLVTFSVGATERGARAVDIHRGAAAETAARRLFDPVRP